MAAIVPAPPAYPGRRARWPAVVRRGGPGFVASTNPPPDRRPLLPREVAVRESEVVEDELPPLRRVRQLPALRAPGATLGVDAAAKDLESRPGSALDGHGRREARLRRQKGVHLGEVLDRRRPHRDVEAEESATRVVSEAPDAVP